MHAFWKQVQAHLQKGEKTFIALVAENTKGSPGTPGAKFLVAEDGSLWGTMGGGIMEFNLVEKAGGILKEESFFAELQTLQHGLHGGGDKSGLICDGSQTNVYYLCTPERDGPVIDRIVELIEADANVILCIDSSGLRVNDEVVDLKIPKIRVERSGDGWLYKEQLLNRKRLAIIGGGHCAIALLKTMDRLGYEVFIYETREDVFTLKNAPEAREIRIVSNYREAGNCIRYPELTCVVIMTTNLLADVDGLFGAIQRPFPYIGVMGSMTKLKKIYENLEKEGVEKEKLDRLYAPIGLSLDSDTPDEIAISVAAQILQERNIAGKLPRN